jgi:maleate cis-trans isomerase
MVPSVNVVLEEDVPKHLGAPAIAHYTRVKLSVNTPEEIASMIDYVPRCASDLADARVDIIGFACTGGSVIGGKGYDERIVREIVARTGIPATTTATAIIEALRHLDVSTIALGTPYESWLNAREVTFFEQNGFKVVSEKGLGVPDPRECQAVGRDAIQRLAREVDRPDAQAIVLSCANFRAWDVAADIEKELGKAVVTSNQAIVWHMLRTLGHNQLLDDHTTLCSDATFAAV